MLSEQDYLARVTAKITYGPIRDSVKEELQAHIQDQKEAYLSLGMGETEALSKALSDMGDPLEIGESLGAAYRPKGLDWHSLFPMLLLLVLGLALRLLFHEAISVCHLMALAVFLFTAHMDVSVFLGFSVPLYVGYIALTIFLGSVGWSRNGSMLYAQYVPLFYMPFYAALLFRMKGRGWKGLFILFAALLLPTAIIGRMAGFGSQLSILLSALLLLSFAIWKHHLGPHRCRYLLSFDLAVFGVCFLVMVSDPYYFERIKNIPMDYMNSILHQVLENCRFFGEAVLPETLAHILSNVSWQNSYLLVLLAVRFGLVVYPVSLLLWALAVFGMARVLKTQGSMLGQLLSLSVILCFSFQYLLYVAANLGYTLGIFLPLPFLASGNSSLLCNAFLLGVLFSVQRYGLLWREPFARRALPRLKVEWN